MAALVIPIHDLDSVGKDFVFALDEAWLRTAFTETGVSGDASAPGEVTVHAQRNGSEILVHGQAHARLITECGRCLSPVPVDVACELAALYAPEASAPRQVEEEDEDLDIDPDAPDREYYRGEQVLIDDLVRDYLLLELPMQPRCEPECELPVKKGSKTQPELGEGIDPRLQPLLKLAKGEREKE